MWAHDSVPVLNIGGTVGICTCVFYMRVLSWFNDRHNTYDMVKRLTDQAIAACSE